MTKTTQILITVVLAILATWGCASLDPIAPESVNTGSLSFARFHVVGDGMTAGIQNGGLVEGFQKAAWPSVIGNAVQMSAFALPTITENGIPPLMYVASFSPLRIDTLETLGSPTNLMYAGFYNNMGIPSAFLHQLVYKRPDVADANPFFQIVLRDSTAFGGASTAAAQMAAAQPTLALIWAGVTDILESAKAGTDLALTPVGQFEADYRTLLTTIMSTADNLVAANIHNVIASPYFTTLPPVVLNPATGKPVLDPGGQMIPLLWDNAGSHEPMPPTTLVLLPAKALMQQGYGIPVALSGRGEGLPGSVLLFVAEYTNIAMAVGQYNAIIDSLCANRGVPVVDLYTAFNRWFDSGYDMRGETYTTDYISGGLFSIDGLYPSSILHYAIGLEFIKKLNSSFGAAIPEPLIPIGPFRDPRLGATTP